jgi:hypothetical protein
MDERVIGGMSGAQQALLYCYLVLQGTPEQLVLLTGGGEDTGARTLKSPGTPAKMQSTELCVTEWKPNVASLDWTAVLILLCARVTDSSSVPRAAAHLPELSTW